MGVVRKEGRRVPRHVREVQPRHVVLWVRASFLVPYEQNFSEGAPNFQESGSRVAGPCVKAYI